MLRCFGRLRGPHFAINTDINKLISPDLPWRKREIAFEAGVSAALRSILMVVDAPTPELPARRPRRWPSGSSTDKKLFKSIAPAGRRRVLRRNGLLFLPVAETEKVAGQLARPSR